MTTNAGYTDATPLLGENLRRLAALEARVPVLSLYLDLNPTDFGTHQARRSAYTSLLDEAGKRAERHGGDHDAKMSLRADLERAQAFLDDYRPTRGRGLAIFAASGADLFETYTLPRSPQTHIEIADKPYVTPLLAAADPRDWLVVLVDARHARFLHGNPDHLEELEHVTQHVAGQHERQSTSDHQRWVEHQVDDHLKAAAAEVDRRLGAGRYDRVLVGGSPELAPRFAEHHISNPARERLAGRFEIEVPDTTPDDVRAAAAPRFEEDERRAERAVLDRLAERLGRGERAAAGLADVRAMLEQARVETLIYDDGGETPEPAVLEAIVADALAQNAEVVPLRHHRGEFAQQENTAALLRF